MRLRSTLLLAIVFAAIGGYVYFVEFDKAAQEEKKKTLFDVSADDISEITLTYSDHEIALTKTDGAWNLTRPVQSKADETAAKNLARAIAECEFKKTLDDAGADLATYGLQSPTVTVKVVAKGKELPQVKVGKNTPIGYNTYVQLSDSPKILLAAAAFEAGMKKEVNDLRDKQIVEFSDDAVTRITVKSEAPEVQLAKVGGVWKIEQPAAMDADETIVRSFLSTLRTMRATNFADDTVELQNYGLDIPHVRVTLTTGSDNKPIEVWIGSGTDNKENYVKTADRATIFLVSDWVARDLAKSANDFRDKTPLSFDKDAVNQITINRTDHEAFTLTRSDAKVWSLSAGDVTVEAGKVDLFLSDLHDLKGYEIVGDSIEDLARYGLAEPALSIKLENAKGELGTIHFGSYAANEKTEYVVMADGSKTVMRVREFNFNRINKRDADFLPKPTPTPGK